VVTNAALFATTQGQRLLQAHTLVLNRHWVPVGFTHVRRAVSLVYDEAARVIAPDTYVVHDFSSWSDASQDAPEDECIRSVSLWFRVPEIILLTRYDGVPRAEVPFSRRNLCIRDRFTCQYCGKRVGGHDLTIDHLIPRSKGGPCSWHNCVVACVRCNGRKGNRTPKEARMKLAQAVGKPRWSPSYGVPLALKRLSWQQFIGNTPFDIELEV